MKKAIFIVLAAMLAITLALLIYLKRPVLLGESRAAELVPDDTVALFQVADIERSRDRWKQTALYQIAHEPEVQAFLEKPESKVPHNADVDGKWSDAKKLQVKEVFAAVTSVTDKVPKFVAGFDYKGSRGDAETFVNDLKSELKAHFPSGKSDIQQYDSHEIETFQVNDVLIASVFKSHWFLVSDDLDLLKATMGRLDGISDGKALLRDNAAYKAAIAKLPADADAICFVQPHTLVARFESLMSVSNPNFDPAQLDDLKKVQAVSAGMKLDGERIRDAIYFLKPGGAVQPAMARNSLAFTSPATFLYLASVLNLKGAPKLPDASLDSTGIVAVLTALQTVLEAQGLSFEDFKTAFGPEIGMIGDWPQDVLQPSVLLNLDVRDNAKARKFVDAFANGQVTPWAQQEIDGVRYYSLPQESAGIIPLAPVLGLTDKALLFGLSFDSVQKAVQSAKSGDARLDKQADFKAASDLVSKPTGMFGYIDSKQLFEKVYGFASTYLKAMALFNPHAGDYADLSKLPSTEAVSKHLSPIVYSMGTDDKGTLVESAGPVTFNQALFALAAGAGWKFSTQPKAYAMPSGGTPSVPQLPSKPPPMQVPLNPPAGSGTLPSLPQTSPPPP